MFAGMPLVTCSRSQPCFRYSCTNSIAKRKSAANSSAVRAFSLILLPLLVRPSPAFSIFSAFLLSLPLQLFARPLFFSFSLFSRFLSYQNRLTFQMVPLQNIIWVGVNAHMQVLTPKNIGACKSAFARALVDALVQNWVGSDLALMRNGLASVNRASGIL